MFSLKSLRNRVALSGATAAVAIGLVATVAAPAGAVTPAPVKPAAAATAADPSTDELVKVMLADAKAKQPKASPMIIGGTKVSIKSYPFMAQIWVRRTDTSADGYFCSASVVGPRKILTAAHCVAGRKWKTRGVVVLGATHIIDGSLHGGTPYKVSGQWSHPKYNKDMIDNDVAVLTLAKSTRIKPIKITSSSDTKSYRAGTKATVLGWGRTSSKSDNLSSTLRRTTQPMRSNATCKSFWQWKFVSGHMVCAGYPASGQNSGTHSTCNGDSGGPLIVNGRVVGITSWVAVNCVYKGSYPVYAKVSTYAKILNSHI